MKNCKCEGMCKCKRESIIEQGEQVRINETHSTLVDDITRSIRYLIMNHQPKVELNDIYIKAYKEGFSDGVRFGYEKYINEE